MPDLPANIQQPPTIYDVARAAGVSIASVSRVLNGHRNPRQETRDRVLQAVAELGFVPDGAARALSVRLKEVVGVVFRRVPWIESAEGTITEEDESLQFTDVINRGIEVAAQLRGFNLLVGSVDVDGHDAHRRIMTMARKSDGLILHDRVLEPSLAGPAQPAGPGRDDGRRGDPSHGQRARRQHQRNGRSGPAPDS